MPRRDIAHQSGPSLAHLAGVARGMLVVLEEASGACPVVGWPARFLAAATPAVPAPLGSAPSQKEVVP